MSTVVVQVVLDAQNLTSGLNQAQAQGNAFAKNTEKQVTGRLNKAFSNLGNTIKNSLLPVFAIGALVGKVGRAIADAQKTITEFQSAVAELSAITGATGEDLEFFREQAISLGPEFGKSASEIADAFKLVGSARPELLANGEALAEVTKQALTLSQASGQELESSVASLTSVLNQFGIPAEQAADTINTLAAGSKAGAAPVDDIAQSINAFGAVADQANVSVEESVALVETLADKSIVGADAGTKLRNVLTILSTADALPKEALNELEKFGVDLEVVTNKALPLNRRLEEFSKISGDATALVKVFGRENQVAGSILLKNVDRFNELTEAVTGTNVAFEQAEIVSQTLAFQQQQTEATYESFILSLDNGQGALSQTATDYERLKQGIFEVATALNDGTLQQEESLGSINKLIDAASEFGLVQGSVAESADETSKELAGINLALDRYVEKSTQAAFAAEDSARTINAAQGLVGEGQEDIDAAVAKTEEAFEAQREKVLQLIDEAKNLEGAEQQRAIAAVELQNRVLESIEAEIEARKEAAREALINTPELIANAQAAEIARLKAEEEEQKKGADKKKQNAEKLEKELAELRIRVLKDGEDEELALLELQFQEELERFRSNEEAKKLLTQQFEQDSQDIRRKFAEQDAQIRQDALQEIEANRREAFDLEQQAIERAAEEQKLINTQQITDAEELADAEVQVEIQKLEKIIALRRAAGEDTLAQEQQLAQLRLGIRQEEIANEAEIAQQRKDAAIELASTLRDVALANLQAQTEAQINSINEELETQLAAIDEQLKAETLSEEERERLIARRAKLEEDADTEVKKLQREQAERERSIATFEALINGAVAFTKALTIDPTGVLAAITAAQVLAQVALINSQPLPEFAKGTDYAPGGYALVGEQGPEIMYVPRGAQIKTNTESKRLIGTSNLNSRALRDTLNKDLEREIMVKYYGGSQTTSNKSEFNDFNILRSEKETRKVLYYMTDRIVETLRSQNSGGRGTV